MKDNNNINKNNGGNNNDNDNRTNANDNKPAYFTTNNKEESSHVVDQRERFKSIESVCWKGRFGYSAWNTRLLSRNIRSLLALRLD
jgi:hypothetical protein